MSEGPSSLGEASALRTRVPSPEPGTTLRLATRADNHGLCGLFASITMESDLCLAVERDPNFFALYDLERQDLRTWVLTDDERIEAVATLSARDGWLGGQRARLGYAGDLRFSPKVRGGRFLGRTLGPCFREGNALLGFDVALTAVISSNRAAISGLVERNPKYPDKPVYRLLRRFQILNIQLLGKKKPRAGSPWNVRRGRTEDIPVIAAFLAADHRNRPFGYDFEPDSLGRTLLDERFSRWPGLTPESFYLAEDGAGRLVGVTAVWDPSSIKRFRVVAYRGRMRLVRVAVNTLATFTGAARLPPAGGLFRYFYLTHVSVLNDDPTVMAALVDRVYADAHGKGFNFFSACVYEGDALASAYSRFQTTALPAGLYAMTAPGGAWEAHDFGPGRFGFEMALV